MFWSAFVLGLVSSLHCLGMCGPLQAAFTSSLLSKKHYYFLFLFHFSRILVYGILGLVIGFFGRLSSLQEWQQKTSLISGLLLLFAFLLFFFLKLDQRLFKLLFPYIHRLRSRLEENKNSKFAYFTGTGILNGILPCAMVYLALFPAMGLNQPLFSFIYMLIFGLGTIPILFLSNISLASFFQRRRSLLQKISPIIIVITAGLLILRGMDLGIPFLSPDLQPAMGDTQVCD
tara:strand:- start:1345 stop:2037 length:693 start_codon:yes stop_codon:yes gene_type:complete